MRTTLILHVQNPPTVSSIRPSPSISFFSPNQSLPFSSPITPSSSSLHKPPLDPFIHHFTQTPARFRRASTVSRGDGFTARSPVHSPSASSTPSPKIGHYQTFAGLKLLQCRFHSTPVSPPYPASATAQARRTCLKLEEYQTDWCFSNRMIFLEKPPAAVNKPKYRAYSLCIIIIQLVWFCHCFREMKILTSSAIKKRFVKSDSLLNNSNNVFISFRSNMVLLAFVSPKKKWI
ncbi:uncharacterized protein LOC108324701 [Vigna angularis]|uniref:uncharacterized protein LOC108324701 n=1 Tax=Phaseolus angularis TaxID=3914 RepID=UPI00080A4D15|nr:uncharacterized protein LOC108324701 [Vigna angularis]